MLVDCCIVDSVGGCIRAAEVAFTWDVEVHGRTARALTVLLFKGQIDGRD